MAEIPNASAPTNPFRPGAGHPPPYLAGRKEETKDYQGLLRQSTVFQNLVLTGLRGIGKTVLLETFKPIAISEGWLWAGTDLSESTSISEERLAVRLITDLALVSSGLVVTTEKAPLYLAQTATAIQVPLNFSTLLGIYNATPGLVSDKIKAVLEVVAGALSSQKVKGLIFAYDEAQNLSDHALKEQYPLSLLLDVFQSIQRKGIPFMLVLTGLPTLFPKLVSARTFAERMFHVITLEALSKEETYEAVHRPIDQSDCPIEFDDESIDTIWLATQGYPYFIQFVCREIFDIWVQHLIAGTEPPAVPIDGIVRKLDSDFFAGRWARPTDRQRQLLAVIAQLENCDGEFTVQEIVEASKKALKKPFSSSHVNQMLSALSANGLIFKNRYGKYSFAVPLMGQFIRRQTEDIGLVGNGQQLSLPEP